MCQKKDFLGPNLAVFGSKVLIFTGGSKRYGTLVTEKTPKHLVCIVFWSGMGSNGPKRPIFDQKSHFWAKFGRLWAQNPNFYENKKKFWYPHNGKPPRQLVRIVFLSDIGSNGPKKPIFGQKCQFWAKFSHFFYPKSIFGGLQ